MQNETPRITNNGRGFLANPGKHVQYGFICRSFPETLVVKACWQRKILYAPNCCFSYRRKIEVDGFFVIHGICLALELDSSFHNDETMFEAEGRLQGFRDQGVPVVRTRIPANADMNWANTLIDRILEKIQKIWWQSYIAHGQGLFPSDMKSNFTVDVKTKSDIQDMEYSDKLPF